jgi:hypothetical protein
MPGFDPALASPFHMDWLVPLDGVTEDDYTRAVAEKAQAILRAARFIAAQQVGEDASDVEIRVWVEAACGNACVSITWEPGPARFGFHLLDEGLRERLGCIVFHDVPSVDADQSMRQADHILDAAMRAVLDMDDRARLDELAHRVRESAAPRRVPVVEGSPFDHGVDK